MDLKAQAIKSIAWYGATRAWAQGVSWVVTILLARLLAPQDYGLFAMAISVLALIELFQEFGLGTAIVQRQDMTTPQLNATFWIVAMASVALTGVTIAGAGLIGHLYSHPDLAWMVRLLSLTFLVNSLGIIPHALLTKAVDLRRRSMAEAIGVVASALVALILAYGGYGVWALAIGHLAKAVSVNTALARFAAWYPGFEFDRRGLGEVLQFGLRVTGAGVAATLSAPINTLIVGRILGGSALGLYSMAQDLAAVPHRVSTALINQVSLPVFARLQRDREALGRSLLKISKYLAVVSLPVHIGIALVAPDLVPLLLSSKWTNMIPLLQLFSIGSVCVALTLTPSPLLTALGRPDILLKFSFINTVGMAAALLVGAWFGLVPAAAAVLAWLGPLRFYLLVVSLKQAGISLSTYFNNLRSPLTAMGAMTLALSFERQVFDNLSHLPALVLSVVLGAIVYTGGLLLCDRKLGTEIIGIAREILAPARA